MIKHMVKENKTPTYESLYNFQFLEVFNNLEWMNRNNDSVYALQNEHALV